MMPSRAEQLARHYHERDNAEIRGTTEYSRVRRGTPWKRQASGRCVGHFFRHLEQELARLAALDLVERLDNALGAGGLQEPENALRVAGGLARGRARRAPEEE